MQSGCKKNLWCNGRGHLGNAHNDGLDTLMLRDIIGLVNAFMVFLLTGTLHMLDCFYCVAP